MHLIGDTAIVGEAGGIGLFRTVADDQCVHIRHVEFGQGLDHRVQRLAAHQAAERNQVDLVVLKPELGAGGGRERRWRETQRHHLVATFEAVELPGATHQIGRDRGHAIGGVEHRLDDPAKQWILVRRVPFGGIVDITAGEREQ